MCRVRLLVCTIVVLALGRADTEEQFWSASAADLAVVEGQVPASDAYVSRFLPAASLPYAASLDGSEMYLVLPPEPYGPFWDSNAPDTSAPQEMTVVARSEGDTPPSGLLVFPTGCEIPGQRVRFSMPGGSGNAEAARWAFFEAKAAHYERLQQAGLPGAAWFRHEAREARAALGQERDARAISGNETPDENALEGTFALFTGGRAVSENLRLDRELRVDGYSAADVPIDTIETLTVAPIDWAPFVKDLAPEKDPLARFVPADQHMLLFPSFQAMLDVMDEAKANGTPVLRLFETQSEDARTEERYERQLCLAPDDLTRILGPKIIRGVAVTGSDPYLRTGSDVAFLFESEAPEVVAGAITARHETARAANPGAEAKSGDVRGVAYTGVATPTRSLCSYVAVVENTVIVTNSTAQLDRIVAAVQGETPALAALDEYTYFRARYARGDAAESALLVVTDAALRRWCGPRWRIAASRRTRAAALLAEQQAAHLGELAAGITETKTLEGGATALDLGVLTLTPEGVHSSIYGTTSFLTPIVELPIENATGEEADAYGRFRDFYQLDWSAYFDPIALRFEVTPGAIGADLTIRPLVLSSDYREYMTITGNRALRPGVGDPHAEALCQFVMSLDPESRAAQPLEGIAMLLPGVSAEPLKWLGDWITVYADADPIWEQCAQAAAQGETALSKFTIAHVFDLPVVLHIDAKNPLALTVFLAGARAFIEQSAPGMLTWENREHEGQAYVRVGATEETRRNLGPEGGEWSDMAFYYAPAPDALILTLSEKTLKRTLERRAAKAKDSAPSEAQDEAWLGECMALRMREGALTLMQAVLDVSIGPVMQQRSCGNLPILNEWHRRFGGADPVAFHEQTWGTRLICPAGGQYVWNEEFQTMESTVCGHPAAPKIPAGLPDAWQRISTADFGVTFEEDGLRARARITRTP